ncbi:MAG: aminotransferase class I/II-fold pyridoxal phosphate-dependent enzyme [Planctomycetes bacterium]|nr:aminotransferase class I/II-fold pyridoxal phosphate-dependent enzyme [Planctomycetota bacterium]
MPPVHVARRIAGVEYAIRDIVAAGKRLEATGRQVTYLNIGDPNKFDFAPPPHVMEAFARAARDTKFTSYAPSEGIPALREAIAAREKVKVDDVLVTAAMSEGILACFASMLDAGDDVLLPSPCYPLYQALANLFEAHPALYRCDPRTWEPDLDHVRSLVTPRTRCLVVIDPNNPTGVVYSETTLKGLVEIARWAKIPIFLDQAYDRLTFAPRGAGLPACAGAGGDARPASGASVPPAPGQAGRLPHQGPDLMALRGDVPVIVGYSMSKVFIFPGARCGYLAFHGKELEGVRDGAARLGRARLCSNHPIQQAFLAGLTGPMDFLPGVIAKLRERAALTTKRLNAIPGLSCVAPQAAFYAFPKIEKSAWKDDQAFVLDLLEATGILTVHGAGFSSALDGPYFRIVFLLPTAELETAYDAMGKFMRERVG